ncbi:MULTISPECIES: phosphopantetheine-binding protein [unclassified Paenibacillus]|uniref:acyl carrier protein n=1 Tax=unclassified Paenibacillus TaxID=185978 RepID=UPI001AE7428E|nr:MULTISPECIES: phosphopantetheine-binding protein [unclassified Paenibacillus]MBP1153978.1 acyl carrier protein [Paenibacillus sp. PvP091]MBP1170637.1 acyl carrier protein [Paenibacillus sp. PvR098]MBP2441665.1 acyl carrier protein [Paenibacillus sp. PvP052]
MRFEQFGQLVSDITNVRLEDVRESSRFREDLGIDSLQMVNLFTQLTVRFQVGVEVIESADDLLTVGNLYRALHRGEIK